MCDKTVTKTKLKNDYFGWSYLSRKRCSAKYQHVWCWKCSEMFERKPTRSFSHKYNCLPLARPSVIRCWVRRGREFQSPMPFVCFEVLRHMFSHVDVCILARAVNGCAWMNEPPSCWLAWILCGLICQCLCVSKSLLLCRENPHSPQRLFACPPHRNWDYGYC